MSEIKQMTHVRSLLPCRRIKPASLLDVLECQQCPLFGGEVIVMRYEEPVLDDNGKVLKNENGDKIMKEIALPTIDYICKLPTKIRVLRQVSEV